MPNILALSRELRDLIYIFVLNEADSPPPSSPADSGERQQSYEEFDQCCKVYPKPSVHIRCAALLLTNRQIHAEFAPWVARLKKSGPLRYKLDCMLYEQEAIYPTWLSVPALASCIDVVEVDFRLFGDSGGYSGGFMGEWESNYHGQSRMIWGLWALLRRFLSRGPDLLSREKCERKIEVETLMLNIIDTSEPDEDSIWGYDRCRDMIMHSETVVWRIQEAMKCLLERTTSPELVFERVKTMVLHEDGKERKRWNFEARRVRLTA